MLIINDDCFNALPNIESASVDLTLFSPPYESIRQYNEYPPVDYTKLGTELLRVTKDGGVCVIVIGDSAKNFAKTITSFRIPVLWNEIGWKLFETCIYHRAGNPGAWWRTRFRVDHEYIHIFFKGTRPKTFNREVLFIPSLHAGKTFSGTDRLTSGKFKKIKETVVNELKCRGTVWPYATSNSERNKVKLRHPATFPDKLAEDIIKAFSNEGDTILDPMVGSGTTCLVADRLKRESIGIEISKEYVNIINQQM